MSKKIKFIDLFAGIGGTRVGFEQACSLVGLSPECVFTSEIKPHAVKVYTDNFPREKVHGDITKISSDSLPDFDFLLAGFPCQPFSSAGKGHGFLDTRGTLFFEIERILRDKNPYGFLLENVEGLVTHDRQSPKNKIGRTLETILSKLEALGYKTTWVLLDSKHFNVPQSRKRIYIVGTKEHKISLDFEKNKPMLLKEVLEEGTDFIDTPFTKLLLGKFKPEDLYGKSVKDKRGGKDNIHSWDIGFKGDVSEEQKKVLNFLLKERRKKHWALKKGISWMDGMPLSLNEISSVLSIENLKHHLDDLVGKGYLRFEHPKDLVTVVGADGSQIRVRKYDESKEKGYNIVTGKLSFEISKVLHPEGVTPTLVATDVDKFAVIDSGRLRRLTLRECLRLFGFPDSFKMDLRKKEGFDLLGNTVVIPVIQAVATKLLKAKQGFVDLPRETTLFPYAEGNLG